MKRVVILSILCIGLITLIHAQQTEQAVIAPAGSVDEIHTISIEWTLGELAVQTLTNQNIMLTEGFHQPWLQVEEIIIPPQIVLDKQVQVSVFPNPVQFKLNIKIEADLEGKARLSLKTIEGQLMKSETIDFDSKVHEWDIINYPAGFYVLTLHNHKGELLKSFKITKIH